jgi:hypothetical protein
MTPQDPPRPFSPGITRIALFPKRRPARRFGVGKLPTIVLLLALAAPHASADEPATSPSGEPFRLLPDLSPTPGTGDAHCLDGPRFEIGAEYLTWWLREGHIPAILTTSSQSSQGLLGQPDTKVLYGDERLKTRHDDRFVGARVRLEYWFDDEGAVGVEANAFFLERDSTYFKAVSDGSVLLARPFFTPNGSPASDVIAGLAPTGLRNGGFVGYSRIELFGEEANLAVAPLLADNGTRLELLAGFHFLQMRDRTDLTATGRSLPDQVTLFGLTDHYRVHNAYYGGQVGARGSAWYGRWSIAVRGEIGIGADVEQVRAFGDGTFQTPFVKIVTPTGLTVQARNTGTFDRTALNMVAEVGVVIGYRLTNHLQLLGGYSLLLWDSPLRSGDQIDLVVNTNAGTPPARPAIPFRSDFFWAQGVNVGLEFSW